MLQKCCNLLKVVVDHLHICAANLNIAATELSEKFMINYEETTICNQLEQLINQISLLRSTLKL